MPSLCAVHSGAIRAEPGLHTLSAVSVGARYDGLAEWYDSQLPSAFSEAVEASVSALLGFGDGVCLDVGCGGGQYFETLAGLGWRVTGTDMSEDQLAVAHPRAEAVGAELVRCDATTMPFADGTFDAVAAIMISTDIHPYERVLTEAARVLRPGGRFVHVGVHPCFAGPHSRFIEGSRPESSTPAIASAVSRRPLPPVPASRDARALTLLARVGPPHAGTIRATQPRGREDRSPARGE